MRRLIIPALATAALLIATNAPAQVASPAPGMTLEQAKASAERMMMEMGKALGVDPDALRKATPEEREQMLREATGKAMAKQNREEAEGNFDVSPEEMDTMRPDELRARMMGRTHRPKPAPMPPPPPLLPMPKRGFPDGSLGLPTGTDGRAVLSVEAPAGREFILVAADVARRRIMWRTRRTPPFAETLDLGTLAADPADLVVELIDPDTHRVVRRYRPVAAPQDTGGG